jgi:hypothetical protein
MVQTAIENRIVPGAAPDNERGIDFQVSDREGLGRFIMKAYAGVAKRGDLFDPQMRERFRAKGITTVELGSPLMSTHPHGTYALSYGVDERGRQMTPGAFVGIMAAQSIGEPMTQLILGSKHVQGVTGKGVAGSMTGFEKLKALLTMPQEMPNKAAVAMDHGTVESVQKTHGGHDIRVAGKTYFTAFDPVVKPGAKVSAGDRLSEGLMDPREILETKGVGATRRYLVDEIHGIFNGNVRKKHIETVVRSVTDTGLITDSGNRHDIVEGDSLPLNLINAENHKGAVKMTSNLARNSMLMEEVESLGGIGKILTDNDIERLQSLGRSHVLANPNPVRFRPVLKGVEIQPFVRKDWMGALSYRRLRDVVQKGVAEGWKSDVSGWNPIPGLAYGATLADPVKAPPMTLPSLERAY